MSSMLPEYSTELFTEIWEDVDSFKADLAASPFNGCITTANQSVLYYLLYARYGNNPIANKDINQWKYKMFSVMFQYGPTWEKRLDVQSKLRGLSDTDILVGSKAIYNSAVNPSTAPTTSTLEEITYINNQNTSNLKKSKMDAYAQLLSLLETDVTEDFLIKFKKCFKIFVAPEKPMLFVTDVDDSEII